MLKTTLFLVKKPEDFNNFASNMIKMWRFLFTSIFNGKRTNIMESILGKVFPVVQPVISEKDRCVFKTWLKRDQIWNVLGRNFFPPMYKGWHKRCLRSWWLRLQLQNPFCCSLKLSDLFLKSNYQYMWLLILWQVRIRKWKTGLVDITHHQAKALLLP